MEAVKIGTGQVVGRWTQGDYWTWKDSGGSISVQHLRPGDRMEVGRFYSRVERPADTDDEFPRQSDEVPGTGYWWIKFRNCRPHLRFMRAGDAVPENSGFVGACVPTAYALLATGKRHLHEAIENQIISMTFQDGEWFASLDGAHGDGKTPGEAIDALCESYLMISFPQAGFGSDSERAALDGTLADGLADAPYVE